MILQFIKLQKWSLFTQVRTLIILILSFCQTTHVLAVFGTKSCHENKVVNTCEEKNKYLSDRDVLTSSEPVMLHFRIGSSLLETDFMSNKRSLEILRRTLSNSDFIENVKNIAITATASPEGSIAGNEVLARNRAYSLKNYLLQNYPFLDDEDINTYPAGENWSGLKKMVQNDPNVPNRSQVLRIIDTPVSAEQRKEALRQVEGNAYGYIVNNIYPQLRGVVACMIYYSKTNNKPVVIYDTIYVADKPRVIEIVRVDTVYIEKHTVVVEKPSSGQGIDAVGEGKKKIRYVAIKNNVLYDAALLPNLAVEFALPKRWSIEVEGMWSWWNTEDSKRYFHRIQLAGVEVRKWLGSKSKTPLTGHYFGFYGMGGTYDVRYRSVNDLCDGTYSFGLSYGYSLPIARRFNLEFGIGVGYWGGEYKKYTFDPEYNRYPWQSTHQRNYVGPTKAKISLVWLIGTGVNVNKKKGRK